MVIGKNIFGRGKMFDWLRVWICLVREYVYCRLSEVSIILATIPLTDDLFNYSEYDPPKHWNILFKWIIEMGNGKHWRRLCRRTLCTFFLSFCYFWFDTECMIIHHRPVYSAREGISHIWDDFSYCEGIAPLGMAESV